GPLQSLPPSGSRAPFGDSERSVFLAVADPLCAGGTPVRECLRPTTPLPIGQRPRPRLPGKRHPARGVVAGSSGFPGLRRGESCDSTNLRRRPATGPPGTPPNLPAIPPALPSPNAQRPVQGRLRLSGTQPGTAPGPGE